MKELNRRTNAVYPSEKEARRNNLGWGPKPCSVSVAIKVKSRCDFCLVATLKTGEDNPRDKNLI
jgi:hypothetical protein